jgi:hypothetical protein
MNASDANMAVQNHFEPDLRAGIVAYPMAPISSAIHKGMYLSAIDYQPGKPGALCSWLSF